MTLQPITSTSLNAFFTYCKTHGRQHDESFLYDENLTPDAYFPGPDEPACILIDESGQITGAASLMLTPAYREKSKGRFRIFHTLSQSPAEYRLLLDAILPHCQGLNALFLFIPADLAPACAALEQAGFTVERFSYVLRRDPAPIPPITLPPDFTLRPFDLDRDAAACCEVRNLAFRVLPGTISITPSDLAADLASEVSFPGGTLVLCHHERIVAFVQSLQDTDDPARPTNFINNLAVHPDYQGQGLGRALLRAAVLAGQSHGLTTCYLVVNAENERGIQLYRSESFQPEKTMICYQFNMPSRLASE